jgi:hypothetical protein
MGKHSKPEAWQEKVMDPSNRRCPASEDGVHYYGSISIDESQCRCGARIRANNSGHG